MKKKICSLLLALLMLVTMLPVTTMATASNDYTQWRQSDSEWNQEEAWPASQYPNASMRWMRQAGCLVTSVAMLLRHYNVVVTSDVNAFNPWICNNALKAAGAFTSGADMYWDGVRKAYPGFVYKGSATYSKATLASLYSQGYACIVGVNGNGHYVAVKYADSSGATIMDPGWGYTSLSSFSSVNTIHYYSATPSAHTCDKGSYVYYWDAHPHYKCYQCSICGEIWADKTETTLLSSCDECRPGKPVFLNMQSTYEPGTSITFAWNSTSNTSHYNLWLYRQDDFGEWQIVERIFYAESGISRTLSEGKYRVQLLSYNSEMWEADGSDWVHTYGDDCFFTVARPELASGTCGENLTWAFENGVLTIDGEGSMMDYDADDAPWKNYRGDITSVVIKSGATTIGNSAFKGCNNIINVTVPETVTSIGTNAFTNCTSLTDVYYGGTEAQWGSVDIGSSGNDPLRSATIHFTEPEPQPPVESSGTIAIQSVRVQPGKAVTVRLDLSANKGISNMRLQLSYPDGFTLENIQKGDALSTLFFTPPGKLTANPVNFVWDGTDADTSEGCILELTFRVADTVSPGDYKIHMSYQKGDVLDNDLEDIDLTLQDGAVTVAQFTYGDVNDDGVINMKDLGALRKYFAGGYDADKFVMEAADVNGDGVVNMKDLGILRRYLAGGYDINLGK